MTSFTITPVNFAIHGSLDIYSVAGWLQKLCLLIVDHKCIILNLSLVDKVDSSAVAFLLEIKQLANNRGGQLRLSNMPPAICTLCDLYGIDYSKLLD